MDSLTLGLAIAGAGLAGLHYGLLVFRGINASIYNQQLFKLLAAGNRDRAIKLGRAASIAAYGRITRAMLERSAELDPGMGHGLVADDLRSVLDTESKRELGKLRRTGLLALVALACALTAAGVGASTGAGTVPTFGLPAMTAVMVFGGWSLVQRRARTWAREGDALLEPLIAYVMTPPGT